MSSNIPEFAHKIRHLTIALVISGMLNIGVLALLLYWTLREHPPTPYCVLKPASQAQQQSPLADQRCCAEVLNQLSQLSFVQLLERLSHNRLVENGLAERDLALSLLVSVHHFDIERALSKELQAHHKRFLKWQPNHRSTALTLNIYPDLGPSEFDALIKFAKIERWPLSAEGLFLQLKKQQRLGEMSSDLVDTFVLTPEFWTVELLFNHSSQRLKQPDIIALLLESGWEMIKEFVGRQRQLHDNSDARRQKFLLDCIQVGSITAARCLLETEWDFAVKKLDDTYVSMLLRLIPANSVLGEHFARELLISPRKTNVQQQAERWLYARFGEPLPKEWNYQAALSRFAPDNATPNVILDVPLPTFPKDIAIKPLLPSNKCTYLAAPVKKVVVATPISKTKNKTTYMVQEGDSLWKIAHRHKVSVEKLKKQNKMESNTIHPGMILIIP